MRAAFVDTVTRLAREDGRLYIVSADMGFSVFENFMKEFPQRFINIGVSEANMIGVSAGLAMSGKVAFAYSIVPFVTMRCFEQIRVDLCYQNVDVKLVGSGGGFSYGLLGPTHHSIEDISIMRSIPNMCVIAPGDAYEAAMAIEAGYRRKGPVYIRLGKNEPVIHREKFPFEIGKGITALQGDDATIISSGAMLRCAYDVAERLGKEGMSVRLISMHTVKPLDDEAVVKAARETGAVFTLEEHSVIGGLGSAVAGVVAERAPGTTFKMFGIPDEFAKYVGTQAYLLSKYSLTADAISTEIARLIKAEGKR